MFAEDTMSAQPEWKDKFIQGGKKALAGAPPNREVALEKENLDLKQLVGELTIANSSLKKAWTMKRKLAVESMTKQGLSIIRACRYAGIARRSYYYRQMPRSARKIDPALETTVRETCNARPCYGCRRITAMVKRKGYQANRKRVSRIMKENGLLHDSLPKRPHWQIHKGSQIAEMPNIYWQKDMTKIWCGADQSRMS